MAANTPIDSASRPRIQAKKDFSDQRPFCASFQDAISTTGVSSAVSTSSTMPTPSRPSA